MPHLHRHLAWPEDVRYELIDGMAYLMAPAPALDHQDIAGEIYFQLRRSLEGKSCRAFIAPVDVRLPEGGAGRHGGAARCVGSVRCGEARRGVRGAPDFVVEVLSPATASHDYLLKRHACERAGVRKYWLVHPADRMLTSYRLVDGRYGEPVMQDLVGSTPVSVLPGVVIAWDDLVSRLPNRIFEVDVIVGSTTGFAGEGACV